MLIANGLFGQSAPSAESVTPSSGAGAVQTFSFRFSDPGGYANLVSVQIDISSQLASAGACYLFYYPGWRALYLASDVGVWQQPNLTVGSAGAQENSQCAVDAGASSATLSGNELVLNLAMRFKQAYAGTKTIWMLAESATTNSGWVARGSWNVAVAPSAVSVTPTSGTGAAQTFSFVFSDPGGAANLISVQIDFSSQLVAAGACYLFLYPSSGALYLADNAGQWQQPNLAVGSAGAQENGQCRVDAGASSITVAGASVTLNLAMSFKEAYAGTKSVFMLAESVWSGVTSGWVARGTWVVPNGLTNGAVTPASGSGASQTFTFTFNNTAGASQITSAQMNFSAALAPSNSCWVSWSPGGISLAADSGGSWMSSALPGSGTLQNSQCQLNVGGSSAVVSGSTLTIRLWLTFKMALFGGAQNVFMVASAVTANGSWEQKGTWTVPSLAALTSPSAGSTLQGSSATFAWTTGGPGVTAYWLEVGTATGTGNVFAGQTASTSTNVANIPMDGQPVYVRLWTQIGGEWGDYHRDYTFTAAQAPPNQPPSYVSVSPGSGSGMNATFAATYSDPNGGTDIRWAYFVVAETAMFSETACYVLYDAQEKLLYLRNLDGLTFQPVIHAGQNESRSTNNCSISGLGAGDTVNGTMLTATFPETFSSNWSGYKDSILSVVDKGGLMSFPNWSGNGDYALGHWTVGSAAPDPVTLLAPANGAGSQGTSVTFSWAPAARATTYDLYLGSGGPPTFIAGITGSTSYTATGLTPGVTYTWYVVAKNLVPLTSVSPTWVFTVEGAPASPAISSVVVNPTPVASSGSAVLSVALSAPAPAGGATIVVRSSGIALPACAHGADPLAGSLIVQAGQTSGSCTLSAGAVAGSTPVTITASYNGSSGAAQATVAPAQALHTVTSNPPGVSVTVDNVPCTTPCRYNWTPGSGHTIATAGMQPNGNGRVSVFLSWSDNGAMTHQVQAPPAETTYAAAFFDVGYYWDAELIALDNGDVFSLFAAWSDSPGLVTSLLSGASLWRSGSQLYGPSDGNVGGASVVKFPPFSLSDQGKGFGAYGFMYTPIWVYIPDGCQDPSCASVWGGVQLLDSISYPAPVVSAVSPSYSFPGSSVEVTLSGAGLGIRDEDLNVYKGITSVNVSGNGCPGGTCGVVASLEPAEVVVQVLAGGVEFVPPATMAKAFLEVAANAAPGTYQLSVTAFGATSGSVSFTVPDQTPLIRYITQAPIQPGQSGSISIFGENFGAGCSNLACPGAAIAVCGSSDGECVSTNVHSGTPTFWSDTRIDVSVNADSNAAGSYYVQVTSAGVTGLGFTPAPNAATKKDSNRKPITVKSNPNIQLKVTSNGTVVGADACAYISEVPAMPAIVASAVNSDGTVAGGTATWRLETTFKRVTSATNSVTDTNAVPAEGYSQPANPWQPSFATIFGGDAYLNWTYNGEAQIPFHFRICGTNPSAADVQTALAALSPPYWMAWKIALHETNASQFCEQGRAQVDYCASQSNWGWPVFGKPAGYGIMQIDPSPTQDLLWNWRSNVTAAKAKLDAKADPVNYKTHALTGAGEAFAFWWRQVYQWNRANEQRPMGSKIAPPADEPETAYCTFTVSRGPDGQTQPYPGPNANTYWFGDAVLMKQYAGTVYIDPNLGRVNANYISFHDRARSPYWSTQKQTCYSVNVVNEVCSCTAFPRNCTSQSLPANLVCK